MLINEYFVWLRRKFLPAGPARGRKTHTFFSCYSCCCWFRHISSWQVPCCLARKVKADWKLSIFRGRHSLFLLKHSQCLFRAAKKDISSIWQSYDLVVFVAANFLSLVGWCLVNIDFCFAVEVDVSVWLMQGFFLFLITLLLLIFTSSTSYTFSFIFWGSYRFCHENCG